MTESKAQTKHQTNGNLICHLLSRCLGFTCIILIVRVSARQTRSMKKVTLALFGAQYYYYIGVQVSKCKGRTMTCNYLYLRHFDSGG